jgi:hypothetical protein
VLGFFMSSRQGRGLSSTSRSTTPSSVGSVGGVVGLIGGLGGFVLPIAFGVLIDLTGALDSPASWLLFLPAWSGAMRVDALSPIRADGDARRRRPSRLAGAARDRRMQVPRAAIGALRRGAIQDWRPEDRPSGLPRAGADRPAQPVALDPVVCCLSFAVWMVWSVVVAKLPLVGFTFNTDELFWLAALPGLSGATLRIFYSFMPPIFGGRLWTTLATWSLLIPARRHRLCGAEPDDALLDASSRSRCSAASAAATSPPRWPTSPSSSRRREGQRAGAQRRARQSRRQRGAVRGAAGRSPPGVFGWLGGDAAGRDRPACTTRCGCRMRLRLRCRSSSPPPSRPGSA